MTDQVHQLAEIWRELIGTDHHKSKDGYFEIVRCWSYYEDKEGKWQANHNAYIGDDLLGEPRDTYEEAEQDLIKFMLEQIRKQYVWATEVLALEDDEHRAWNEREATLMVEVITNHAETLRKITNEN